MKASEVITRVEVLEQGQNQLLTVIENLSKVLVLLQTRMEQGQTIPEQESETPKVHRVSKKVLAAQALAERMTADAEAFKRQFAGSVKTKVDTKGLPEIQSASDVRIQGSWYAVLEETANRVKKNRRGKVFNEKIMNQQALGKVDCPDYRVYLRTSEHRTFRVSYRTAGLNLTQAVIALADEVGY